MGISESNLGISKDAVNSERIILGRIKTIRMPDEISFKALCVRGQLRFTFWAEDVLEIQVIPLDAPIPFDYSWFLQDFEFKFPSPKQEETDFEYVLKTERIQIKIEKKDSTLTILDASGKILQQDDPANPTYWNPREKIVYGQKIIPEGGHFFGFGEKAGPLDKNGKLLEMWNTDDSKYTSNTDPLYQSHPYFLFMNDEVCYGFLFLNHGHTFFDLGSKNPNLLQFWAINGCMSYIIIAGNTPADIINNYTTMVGRMNLPPKWVLGYHQCRWSYMSQAEVLQIAEGFRSRHLPCDAIWLDIDYMQKWQDFTWNRKRFKKPTDLMQKLHNQGFKVVAILDPGIRAKGNEAYKSGDKIAAFCKDKKDNDYVATVWPGKCVFPDFARDDVQEWWAHLHEEILAPGMLDGTWIDMNEPTHFGTNVAREKSTFDMFHHLLGRKISHEELHNVYGSLMAQAEQMAYEEFREQERPFVLTRAGFAGVQRYAAVWTGDNQCTWEHLKLSVPMLLGMGISGIALCGADIGGFSGKCTPELFARWIQLGAFYPFCRNHASKNTPNHEPWVFGDDITEIARKYLYLRYELLPYFYDALVNAHHTGYPIMRALCLEYPKDPKVHNIQYEFLLGDSLLVAPVLDEGVKMWDFYLPGGEWVDFWTEEVIQGGKSISRPTPLDITPLYVRKGAIIPKSPNREFVTRAREDHLFLEIFPGPWTTYTHWEDDGWSKDYRDGKYNEYILEQETTLDQTTVRISPKSTQFSSEKRNIALNIHLIPREPKEIKLNGNKILAKWDSKKKQIAIKGEWERTKTMEFSLQF